LTPPIRLLPRAASLPIARLLLAIALSASFVPAAFGGPPAPPNFPGSVAPSAANDDLARRITAILSGPDLRHASVGVLVQSLQGPDGKRSGRVLFERNASLVFVPASNQKILTAAVALRHLGPDFRFETRIGHTGTLGADGTLRGDVVLTGTGDPSLDTAKLAELARALKSAGVRRVTGRIVADDSRFDERRLGVGWQWDNEPFDYQPQVSALNLDGNVVRLSVAPGAAAGDPALVTLDPPTGYVRVVNTTRTLGASETGGSRGPAVPGAAVALDRRRGQNELLVSGTIPVGVKPVTGALTVEEPSLFAAARLAELLRAQGVVVSDDAPPVRAAAPVIGVVPAGVVRSEPLARLLRTFLKQSDNLYGETLLKAVGAVTSGRGTTAAGARAVAALVAEAGGDARALAVADGSGLSRQNLVSPRNLVALLAHLHVDRAPAPAALAFRDALPVGGVDGTLRARFRNTLAQNAVRAKTGSLSRVSALSGYVTTKAGEPLVFSILMNNYLCPASAARRAQDAIVLALMDAQAPTPAKALAASCLLLLSQAQHERVHLVPGQTRHARHVAGRVARRLTARQRVPEQRFRVGGLIIAARRRFRRSFEHQRAFAARRVGAKVSRDLGKRAPAKLFELFGQLARDCHAPLAAGRLC
jgi:D-alanyl-D-alanine carboxypeptidase/D-alanyl-D-alanine-endopeptidase (penicillin-binding protein 4)